MSDEIDRARAGVEAAQGHYLEMERLYSRGGATLAQVNAAGARAIAARRRLADALGSKEEPSS